VVLALGELSGLDEQEAKRVVGTAPTIVATVNSRPEAQRMVDRLQSAGATAAIR
jgi:ribosomal protein L7/L12